MLQIRQQIADKGEDHAMFSLAAGMQPLPDIGIAAGAIMGGRIFADGDSQHVAGYAAGTAQTSRVSAAE